MINEFLENKADVAIFLTDYVDGEGCGMTPILPGSSRLSRKLKDQRYYKPL